MYVWYVFGVLGACFLLRMMNSLNSKRKTQNQKIERETVTKETLSRFIPFPSIIPINKLQQAT
jgi:hypothetical protein